MSPGVQIVAERSGYVLVYARHGVEVRVPTSRWREEAEMLAEAVAATLFS